MADRRVERRNYQVGTGMMNDPERLQEIAEQLQKSELNHRLPPKQKFGAVLGAPPKPAPALKRKRPLSQEKLRPTAGHPAQQMVGFGTGDDDDDRPKEKIVVKV